MGQLVVQQFVSADGFAANDRNEFDLFDHVEGDSSAFDRSNLEWLEGIGAIVLGANTYGMLRATALRLVATKTLDTFVTIDYALRSAPG